MKRIIFCKYVLIFLICCLILPFLGGCNAPKDQLTKFNALYQGGNLEGANAFAQCKVKDRGKPKGEDLLWALQMASVERNLGRHDKSLELFDRCEEMLNYYDTESTLADGIVTTAVNDNALPYRGEEYDGVMVNTYKALNFMALGNMELARVEFNRALDRQRRAKENFNREIQKAHDEVAKKSQHKSLVQSNIKSDKVRQTLAQKYPSLTAFEAYPDFVNPFATYLAGVYFYAIGEDNKAIDLLRESYGMVPKNNYIAEDLQAAEKSPANGIVWVFFENGLGPIKEEFRIDLPLFVARSKVLYTGIALPKLRFRSCASSYLTVGANGQSYNTVEVANMDRVIQTEFKKDFDIILIRAITSATAKAITQYALMDQNSSGGVIAAIAVAAYNVATNAADVRIWTTLPKNIQVARFNKPEDGKITISPSNGTSFNVEISDCRNAIIYVKMPVNVDPPLYDIITF